MTLQHEGNALIYCENAFRSTNGKTAHGLVRRSERYRPLVVIDSTCAGRDAGQLLDGRRKGIPIVSSIDEGLKGAESRCVEATHFVMGLTPDGGRLPDYGRKAIIDAIARGLHVVSGLHDFISEDKELVELAGAAKVTLFDVRKPPPRDKLHFFKGVIEQVDSLRVAVLGTDSAVGKRTTAWMLVDAFRQRGRSAELIGTGQTAWLQGAKYGMILDSIVNDFVAGEIEHAIWTAWQEMRPEVLVLEGQGSLMNPAYPGGFELLAAGRPRAAILQHAPARQDYDGFPGYPVHILQKQIEAVELFSERPVAAVTINAEGLDDMEVELACESISMKTGLPAVEPLRHGVGTVIDALSRWLVKPFDVRTCASSPR